MKKIFFLIAFFLLLTVFAQAQPKLNDDFYTAVNSKWLATEKIPEGLPVWGGMDYIDLKVAGDLQTLVDSMLARKDLPADSPEAKVATLYRSVLDTEARNKDGLRPLKPYLDMVASIKNIDDYKAVMLALSAGGFPTVIPWGLAPDLMHSDTLAVMVGTADLGLPGQDYYNLPQLQGIRIAYVNYLTKLFVLKGDDDRLARLKAQKALGIEKYLAESLLSAQEEANPKSMHNPRSLKELAALTPAFNWPTILESFGLSTVTTVNVMQPVYLGCLDKAMVPNRLDGLLAYTEACLLRASASYLTSDFDRARFDFFKVLTGVSEMRPQEERALSMVDDHLGWLLGKAYIEDYFPAQAKAEMQAMIKDILAAYRARIDKLDWMSEETKAKAMLKLDTMLVKVAYPDRWEDYSALVVKSYAEGGSLLDAVIAVRKFNRARELGKLGRPVDRNEWFFPPQTVNAYYNPSNNEIVFPAGFLQSPFYHYGASRAENLGGIGVVIGHELTHAFDPSGSKFDEKGNLSDWWQKKDFETFNAKTRALEIQYSAYEAAPGLMMDGRLTLSENIADLGGVTVALDVLKSGPNADVPAFFTAFAGANRKLMLPEFLRMSIRTDPHTPGKFRVNGVLANLDDFHEVFKIKAGDGMFVEPERRIRIW